MRKLIHESTYANINNIQTSKLDINSKVFKTYILNLLSLETLVQSKSCFNLYMLGLVQYYLEIYRFWWSVNIEHLITKWYLSSIVLHVIHILSSRGIQCGWCHLPVSIKRLWEESIYLDNAADKVVPKLHFK